MVRLTDSDQHCRKESERHFGFLVKGKGNLGSEEYLDEKSWVL